MALDDVVKGFAVLNQGLTDLAVSTAAKDAQGQIAELTKQNLSAEDHMKAQSAIGQNLMLRLQQAGAPADQIAATAARFAPSASEQLQYQSSKEQLASTQAFEHSEGRLKHQDALDLQDKKNEVLLGKNAKALQKTYLGFGAEFNKRPDVKPLLDNAPKIDAALEQVKATKGQMGATAMINLAQLGLIRGAAGRVNEKEIEGANESPSKRAQLWKAMGLQVTGEVPMNIQEFWEKVLQRSKDNLSLHINDQARNFAKEKVRLSDGDLDEARIYEGIAAGHGVAAQTITPPKAPGVGAATPPAAPAFDFSKFIKPTNPQNQ